MKSVVRIVGVVALAAVAARVLTAQQVFIPIEPARQFGTGVTPSYEGWFNNPDPDQWVGYGDRTVDEMAHAWMNVTYFNDDEYKALQAERKAKMGKATTDNEKQQ